MSHPRPRSLCDEHRWRRAAPALAAAARTGAGALTSEKVDYLLTRPMRADLDRLLVHDPEIGAPRLAWLTTPAVEATPTSIKLAIDKLMYLRALDAHLLDLSMLPRERRRFLVNHHYKLEPSARDGPMGDQFAGAAAGRDP
jgi:hypothetical protein